MRKKAGWKAICIAVVLAFSVTGCGVNHKSPEGVVKSLLNAYDEGKEANIADCYGEKEDTDKDLKAEIQATIKYFEAHKPKSIKVEKCDIIKEYKTYDFVYVTYKMILEKEKEYPCMNTFIVEKKNKKYYVLSAKEITEDMQKNTTTAYAEFMKSDTYKNYLKEYETFIKKNPGYEEKIAAKLKS